MATELETSVNRILFSNDSGIIAGELFNFLLHVERTEAVEDALCLLYPKTNHCQQSLARLTSRGVAWVDPKHEFSLVFHPDSKQGFTVTCPEMPGLVTEGDSLDEALTMAGDAIQVYLESLRKDEIESGPKN